MSPLFRSTGRENRRFVTQIQPEANLNGHSGMIPFILGFFEGSSPCSIETSGSKSVSPSKKNNLFLTDVQLFTRNSVLIR